MKLKGLSPGLYNITFNIHTVSGIVISFALYIIFFAGAFTLFKDEFYQWENPSARQKVPGRVDYDQVLTSIKKSEAAFDLSEDITIVTESAQRPLVKIYGHLIRPKGKPEQHYNVIYSAATGEFLKDEKTTVGETLYRLHFFDQIPFLGRYLSGFVALFFAFAVITGLMIHWQNMLSKFHGFSMKGSLKNLWTNAHTVFGFLSLPFQLMYAITGAYYMLSFLVLLPVVVIFYGGDQQKAIDDIYPERAVKVSENSPWTSKNLGITGLLEKVKSQNPDLDLPYLQIKHYDRQDGIVSASLENSKTFAGNGSVAISLKDGKLISNRLPGTKTYTESVLFGISRLHFATFAGTALKIIYFLLALFTCFVIISGVLLWKEARNKKGYTDQQKRFHHRVTLCYLAISFSLFPATAILFSAELLIQNIENHVFLVRTVFFVSWLALSTAGFMLKTEYEIIWFYLLIGGLFSILVPLANGFVTGDWIVTAWLKGLHYTALTDVFWAATGIITLILAGSVGRRANWAPVNIDDSKESSHEINKYIAP
ncbi:PepSY domain-containing protein [Dyadobacter sp. CY356]|uniref:PepSY-associated TM helix domain-containing protein n=1 Tax=Dyadobacter sp. CY356 TaxID=2906442 RepID=UPI001F28C950|nr:PepSY-associated TM helix domain-containing protein [Dyadobacter sp. CY356]MCF0055238.1 PepSY domain-containing protein [Dyadobacter sp. CY356]